MGSQVFLFLFVGKKDIRINLKNAILLLSNFHSLLSLIRQLFNSLLQSFTCIISLALVSFVSYLGGLITNQFTLFFTMTTISLLWHVINPFHLLKIYKRKKEIQNGENSLLTQNEAQLLFEDPEFNIGEAYAYIIKNVLFTAFYSFILPLGVPIMILYLVLLYWLNKVRKY